MLSTFLKSNMPSLSLHLFCLVLVFSQSPSPCCHVHLCIWLKSNNRQKPRGQHISALPCTAGDLIASHSPSAWNTHVMVVTNKRYKVLVHLSYSLGSWHCSPPKLPARHCPKPLLLSTTRRALFFSAWRSFSASLWGDEEGEEDGEEPGVNTRHEGWGSNSNLVVIRAMLMVC